MQQFHHVEASHDELPEGFAHFNNCDHLCVSIPDKLSTVSLKLSNGRQITLAFVPYSGHEAPQCCDIVVHNSGKTAKNGSRQVPIFEFAAYCGPVGKPVHIGTVNDKEPTTLLSLSLKAVE